MHSLIEGDQTERQSLKEATASVLEECRMVLPGIEALFGFQLVVIFNDTFRQLLSREEQHAHLVAIAMSAIASAFVMGPAAYHRQVHPESVSKQHLRFSSWMLTLGLIPLLLAMTIDFYLVSRVITGNAAVAGLVTTLIGGTFVGLWIVVPRVARVMRKGRVL